MLGYWRYHKDYQHYVFSELKVLAQSSPESIREYADAIRKLIMLNLDKMKQLAAPLYPPLGRHAEWQPEIFRSFVLMVHLGIPLNNWVDKLTNCPVLRVIAGFPFGVLPKTSSYYDFINRIINMDERSHTKTFKAKPRTKLKKGGKLPPKNPGITLKLAKQLIADEKRFQKRLSRRHERFLQKIFADVCVAQSIERGFVPDSVDISGDGTCIETGASTYGRKVCQCMAQGIYHCNCDRLFSDPNATWGWDSHNERYFYGYTGYFIFTYNKTLKTDLPPPTSGLFKQADMTAFPRSLPYPNFGNCTRTYISTRSFQTVLPIMSVLINYSTTGTSTPLLRLTLKTQTISLILSRFPLMNRVCRAVPVGVK